MNKSYTCHYNIYFSFGSVHMGSLSASTFPELKKRVQEFKKYTVKTSCEVEAITFDNVIVTSSMNIGKKFRRILTVKNPKNSYFRC